MYQCSHLWAVATHECTRTSTSRIWESVPVNCLEMNATYLIGEGARVTRLFPLVVCMRVEICAGSAHAPLATKLEVRDPQHTMWEYSGETTGG